jgi:hypothetical protein
MRPKVQLELCNLLEIAPPDDVEADFDGILLKLVLSKIVFVHNVVVVRTKISNCC